MSSKDTPLLGSITQLTHGHEPPGTIVRVHPRSCAKCASRESLLAEATAGLREAIAHLDFCGYGDTYEREGAMASKLPERLDALLAKLEAP